MELLDGRKLLEGEATGGALSGKSCETALK